MGQQAAESRTVAGVVGGSGPPVSVRRSACTETGGAGA